MGAVTDVTEDYNQFVNEDADSDCSSPNCGCRPAPVDRRQFIQMLGSAGAVTLIGQKAVAGPFEAADFERLVPPDKKLSPDWVRSLYARGQPTVYSGKDLEMIGMPVGGLCAGLLYLGGDGKLWLWDIMNQERPGILGAGTSGENYIHPPKPVSPVRQGFSLQIKTAGGSVVRPLDHRGWKNTTFQGQYPIGLVQYSDPDAPVSVRLEAYSPFIPLNTDDSSLPATLLTYTVTNDGGAPVEVTLAGWMQNAVAMYTALPVVRTNSFYQESSLTFLECGMNPAVGASPQHDHGSMGIGVFATAQEVSVFSANQEVSKFSAKRSEIDPDGIFATTSKPTDKLEALNSSPDQLVGALKYAMNIPAKGARTVTFVITWHFKNLQLKGIEGAETGRHYATRFADAYAVAKYVSEHFGRLQTDTRLWRDTWYRGNLPNWFLERTLANVSILATTTCYRFGTGRFYGWEGVGCCAGTCTHVWSYVNDAEFAGQCRQLADRGSKYIGDNLFNGEYFVQKPDPEKPDVIGSYGTCEIDQVLGQSWAWQVGLGRVLDRTKTLSALGSLWKYNFTPDVGPFRKAFPLGRWYALPGEGGLIMATNPRDLPNPFHAPTFWSAEYFDECMTGFEHQVASHMVAEGMVEQGLAVTRAIHDRYHASRRNPWNEIECSDHYARAMASYGTFLTMCGFEYHGPKQHIGFAPRTKEPIFEASFVAAEGWGVFAQLVQPSQVIVALAVRWGQVPLRTFALQLPEGRSGNVFSVSLNNEKLRARADRSEGRLNITFESRVDVKRGDVLRLTAI